MNALILIGRVFLVAMFIFSGVGKFADLGGTAAMIAAKGLPMPLVLAVASGALEVVGGLLILLGWWTRLAALALMVFTAAALYLFHDFWNAQGAERSDQMIHAMKNLSIIGAFLMLAGFGPGRYSVDARNGMEVRTRYEPDRPTEYAR
jgi:putative oxidoreductase